MEIEDQLHGNSWCCSLLLSVIFLNVCLPNLVLSYGIYLEQSIQLGVPAWLGFITPTLFVFTFNLSQCWCREAVDSWGGTIGYRLMAFFGLVQVVASLVFCAFVPHNWYPYVYGVAGGLGSSIVSAQVDAVVFEMFDSRLEIVRALCITGQAFGQAIFPHIISLLIDDYGYYSSHIILAGIILQTMPAIMLLHIANEIKTPTIYLRCNNLAKTYYLFNDGINEQITELDDMSVKCWRRLSGDNIRKHEAKTTIADDLQYKDDTCELTVTPPPSVEEKRKNILGVNILPEIPEESEDSECDDEKDVKDRNNSKKRLSNTIKRLSILGENFDQYISKQVIRDSENDIIENEVAPTDKTVEIDIEREQLFSSFRFRYQFVFQSIKRRFSVPSYRVYRIRRRFMYLLYQINDIFIKPLTSSLIYWKFYAALSIYFSKMGMTLVPLILLPMIASQVRPKISNSEINFLMSLHAFTWLCFSLSMPWIVQLPKGKYKYVAVFGLIVSAVACIVLTQAKNHDLLSIGCVIAGFGYGIICSTWETTVQDFVGPRLWPRLHSTLETLSAFIVLVFVVIICQNVENNDLNVPVFILGVIVSVVSVLWLIIILYSFFVCKKRSRYIERILRCNVK